MMPGGVVVRQYRPEGWPWARTTTRARCDRGSPKGPEAMIPSRPAPTDPIRGSNAAHPHRDCVTRFSCRVEDCVASCESRQLTNESFRSSASSTPAWACAQCQRTRAFFTSSGARPKDDLDRFDVETCARVHAGPQRPLTPFRVAQILPRCFSRLNVSAERFR